MRLLILGTGLMAGAHARAFRAMPDVDVVGCADLDLAAARGFAETHDIPAAYPGLDAALDAGGFDAVANTTPDAAHYPTTMACLAAGLHVFCEKPLATNHAHAAEMTAAAAKAGVVAGVNLTYRNVSALQKARQIVSEGRIGAVRHFEASYRQSWLTQPAWGDWRESHTWLWRLSTAHGSTGVLGDVGIHIFDFASYAIGSDIAQLAATLTTFDKAPGGRIGDYVLDANDSLTMTARMANGASGVIHASRYASGHLNDLALSIHGEAGAVRITNDGPLGTLELSVGKDHRAATWRKMRLGGVPENYERFVRGVADGTPMDPDFATATALQRVIDLAALSDLEGRRLSVPHDATAVSEKGHEDPLQSGAGPNISVPLARGGAAR